REHVIGHRVHLIASEYAIAAERRHLAHPGLVLVRLPNAVDDRVFDGLEITAPQPVVIIEIRIAFAAGRTGTVALHAVHAKCRLATRDSRAHQAAVFRQSLDRDLRESGEERSAPL